MCQENEIDSAGKMAPADLQIPRPTSPSGDPGTRSHRSRWLGVELRHLMALAAIAREGSFRAAAESLGYVQSAISQQIAALERLLGVQLVERQRGTKPVVLTEAGRLLLRHIELISEQLRTVELELDALTSERANLLRIGVPQSLTGRLVPALLPALRARHPDMGVEVREGCDAELLDLVRGGGLDVAFAELPVEQGPFAFRELISEPYVLLVAATTALARRGAIRSPHELSTLPLLGEKTGRGSARVEAELAGWGLTPRFVFRSDIVATVQALVATGVGAAIVPRLAVDLDDPRTCALDLGELLPPRSLGVVWHAERRQSECLDRFVAISREVASQLGRKP